MLFVVWRLFWVSNVMLVPVGNAEDLQIGERLREVLDAHIAGDSRIVRLHRGSSSEGRLHYTGRACTCSARTARGAARACPGSAGAKASHAASRRTLHDAGVDAAERATRLGTEDVGVGDRQVVASDGDIKIVLDRQRDCVVERNVKLPVADELVEPR